MTVQEIKHGAATTHGIEAAIRVAERHDGSSPLIISLPHVGLALPSDIATELTPLARQLLDTDWHVERLYEFARAAGASWLQARFSRYVIDLNRPPDNQSLYPGQVTSQLCPTQSFSGENLYLVAEPTATEIERRRQHYWQPYHTALGELIDATRAKFGYAVLLDAHSIHSVVPRLFDGRLPDINIGTHDARACAPALVAGVTSVLERQRRFTHVLNGRFKGGYITRHYGTPTSGVHAIQIELAQAAYMDESRDNYDAQRAEPLQSLLREVVGALLSFNPSETDA